MSYRRVRAVCIKEFHHIVRDSRSLAMALAVPVMMLLLFGYGLSLDVDHIPALVYDQDGSPASREIVRQFSGSRFFDVRGAAPDYKAIEREIDRGRILMGIVIPPKYGEDIRAGRQAQVQILIDGRDSNTAGIALGYAEALVRDYALQTLNVQPPVDARLRVWYN